MQVFSGDDESGSITQRPTAAFDIGQGLAAQEPDPSGEQSSLKPLVRWLLSASSPVVARVRLSDQPRRPPLRGESVRVTFLATDGFYFGEGEMKYLQQNALAGPVIQRAVELPQAAVTVVPNK